MQASAAILLVVPAMLGLAACGAEAYGSAEDLKDAVVAEAGVGCPDFAEAQARDDPERHGTCVDLSASFYEFDVDVFTSNERRDEFIQSMHDYPFPFCVAYGEGWAVTFRGDMAQEPYCQVVADRMDAEIDRGGMP